MFASRRFWLGLAVSSAFIALFFLTVDEREMGEALGDADYRYIAPAIFLYFVAVLVRTLRWQYLLSPVRRFALGRLFPVVVVGYMANNLLPFRLGEVVRPYYLGRREGFSASTALATIVVERVYDGLTLLFLAAVAVPFLLATGLVGSSEGQSELAWILVGVAVALIFVAAILVFSLLAISPGFGRFVIKIADFLPIKLRPKARELIGLFIEGLSTLRQPRRHLSLFLLSLPVWLSEGAMYFLIAISFGLSSFFSPLTLLIPTIILVMAASNLATTIPALPGAFGTFEVAAVAALALVGVSEVGDAGAYAFMLHLTLLLPVTALGLVYLWRGNLSLARLMRREEVSEPPLYSVSKGGMVVQEEKKE